MTNLNENKSYACTSKNPVLARSGETNQDGLQQNQVQLGSFFVQCVVEGCTKKAICAQIIGSKLIPNRLCVEHWEEQYSYEDAFIDPLAKNLVVCGSPLPSNAVNKDNPQVSMLSGFKPGKVDTSDNPQVSVLSCLEHGKVDTSDNPQVSMLSGLKPGKAPSKAQDRRSPKVDTSDNPQVSMLSGLKPGKEGSSGPYRNDNRQPTKKGTTEWVQL